jgi:hypothetical protein
VAKGKWQVANTIGADTFDLPMMVVKRGREKSVSFLSGSTWHATISMEF